MTWTWSRFLQWMSSRTDYERDLPSTQAEHAFDLSRMRLLLDSLGAPDHDLAVAHIAGSKGKGTTAAVLESIARHSGRRTGLYTSPHLQDPSERIRINGRPLPQDNLAALAPRLVTAAETLDARQVSTTFFELMTALALVAFEQARVDLAILEVGLGGRLDATNAIAQPLVSAITVIDLEHTSLLGDDIASIAAEKAAIIRPGIPVVSAERNRDALDVITRTARAAEAPLHLIDHQLRVEVNQVGRHGTSLRVSTDQGGWREDLQLALIGRHHADDAAMAIQLWDLVRTSTDNDGVAAGLAQVAWPGRFDLRPGEHGDPDLIVDSAHTARSAACLRDTYREVFADQPAVLLMGTASDKDLQGMAHELLPMASAVVATCIASQRTCQPAAISAAFAAAATGTAPNLTEAPDVAIGLARARDLAKDLGGNVVTTGSVYLAGEVLSLLTPAAPGIEAGN